MKLNLLIYLMLVPFLGYSQCTGLVITGLKSDNPDTVKVMTTQNLTNGSIFYITDKEWNSLDQNYSATEGVLTWTLNADILAGTNIFFAGVGAASLSSTTHGTVSSSGTINLSASGDVIYITNVAPSITMGSNVDNSICFAVGLGSTSPTGNIPTNGVHVGNFDNVKYSGVGSITLATSWIGNDDSDLLILPIRLLNQSLIIDKTIIVSWSTLSETNNSHFTIDHSTDGKTWSEIGRVEAALERNNEKDYAFEHDSPAQGINYYRLNQFDLDGTKTSFDVLAGFMNTSKEDYLFPTITQDKIYLSSGKEGLVKIFDATGKMVLVQNYHSGNAINVDNLSKGQYFLKHSESSHPFIKE